MTDEKNKIFVVIDFSEYFKSLTKKLYSRLRDEESLIKVAKSLYIFLTTLGEVEKNVEIIQSNSSGKYVRSYNIDILNIFYAELQQINVKSMIQNKLKELIS